MERTHLVGKGTHGSYEILGPTVEFLTSPAEADAVYCVIEGTIRPGVSVPLHTHADVESFFVISGNVQVLSQRGDDFEWLHAKPGDFVDVPGGAKHAFRNTSSEPVVQLITTTPQMGRFFIEVGRPFTSGEPSKPSAPEELKRFTEVAARYGYWNASPEENAAVGISVPNS